MKILVEDDHVTVDRSALTTFTSRELLILRSETPEAINADQEASADPG